MNDRQQLQHLIQFDLWCTRKLTDLFFKHEPFREQEAATAFLSHIINAQKIWFNRIVNLNLFDEVDIWDEYSAEDLREEAKEISQLWMDLIADHEVDLDTVITYRNSQNVNYQNTIRQIFHHVIIHGQHHRAQISIFLRNCDITPPQIDYIHYARTDKTPLKYS